MSFIPDPLLDALEDADDVLDLDPQAVAALDPETVALRWRAIRPATLDALLPIPEARAMLLARSAA